MTLRRVTVLLHGLLGVALLACAGWLLWLSLASTPDPDEDWPVSFGFIAIPMAVVFLVSAAVVAFAVRSWMRSGRRAALIYGDLVAGLTVALVGVLMPAPLALGVLGTLVIAGATVAANGSRTVRLDGGPPPPRRSAAQVIAVIVIAVVIGVVFLAPLLLTLLTFADPIE